MLRTVFAEAKTFKTREKVRWIASQAEEAGLVHRQWVHIAVALDGKNVPVPSQIRGNFTEDEFRKQMALLMRSADFLCKVAFVADMYFILENMQITMGSTNSHYTHIRHALLEGHRSRT